MAIATRWKAASKKKLSKILEAMVSGPGYMRNPNPKRAKMSFLSYNRHEIVFVDPKCRILFLATQNVLLLPGSKSGMRPFQGHNHCHRTLRPFGIIIHSRCQEAKKSTRNQEQHKRILKFCTKHLHRPPPVTRTFPRSTKQYNLHEKWGRFIVVTFILTIPIRGCPRMSTTNTIGSADGCKDLHPHQLIFVATYTICSSILRFCRRSSFYALLMRHLEIAGMAQNSITDRIPIKGDETVRVEPTRRNSCSHSGACPLWSSILCRFSWNRCPR